MVNNENSDDNNRNEENNNTTEILMDHKFKCPLEGLSCKPLIRDAVT